jgi:hypothetical protein
MANVTQQSGIETGVSREIMACDLSEEAAKHPHEYALIELDGEAQRLEVLYLPTLQRVGYAWGGPAEWEDAQSLDEAIDVARAGAQP